MVGQLRHEHATDRTGSAPDHRVRAGHERPVAHQPLRRDCRVCERRRILERDVVGHLRQQRGARHHMSGARSEHGRPAHPRPDRDGDVAADRNDAARALEADRERERERDGEVA